MMLLRYCNGIVELEDRTDESERTCRSEIMQGPWNSMKNIETNFILIIFLNMCFLVFNRSREGLKMAIFKTRLGRPIYIYI